MEIRQFQLIYYTVVLGYAVAARTRAHPTTTISTAGFVRRLIRHLRHRQPDRVVRAYFVLDSPLP